MSDDNQDTPRETPVSKSLVLGLESCPRCLRAGQVSGIQCFYCEGGRVVTVAKADKWRAAHAKTDPAPPSGKTPQ